MGDELFESEAGEWVDLIAADDVSPGTAATVTAGDRVLAVCNDDGRFAVLDNTCPHAGGSLGAGEVRAGRVICPWHRWPFSLSTGRTGDEWIVGVAVYPSKVEGGRVWARIASDNGDRLTAEERDLQAGE